MKEQPQDRSQSEDAHVARREFVKGTAAGVVGGLAANSVSARAQDGSSSTLTVSSAAFSEGISRSRCPSTPHR